jgi:SAM-dependent methyltransferase
VPVDPVAQQGFTDALAYERGRPGYAPEAVDLAVAELGLDEGSRVLDLAAGTGKLSRQLVPRVGSLVAVEPLAPMRAVLAQQVPEAEILEGEAERIPLLAASVDAIVVGEAFHWFATDAALAEMARVLRPGGGLALFWNVALDTEPPRPEELDRMLHEAFEASVPETRRYATGAWKRPFEGSAFEPLRSGSAEHRQRIDHAGLVAQVSSWSYIAVLPEAERSALLDRVAALVPDEVVVTLRTDVHWTRRR